MSTLGKAIAIASRAYAKRVDQAGEPRVLHSLAVMHHVMGADQRMTAVLHDLVDETFVTLADLVDEGFPVEVIEALRILKKVEGESPIAAAERAAKNPIARMVKLVDAAVHMNAERILDDPEADNTKLRIYEHVRAILISHGRNKT